MTRAATCTVIPVIDRWDCSRSPVCTPARTWSPSSAASPAMARAQSIARDVPVPHGRRQSLAPLVEDLVPAIEEARELVRLPPDEALGHGALRDGRDHHDATDRSGARAAASAAGPAVEKVDTSVARSMPAASMTARQSSACCSRVG